MMFMRLWAKRNTFKIHSKGDNLHEMSKAYFLGKVNKYCKFVAC